MKSNMFRIIRKKLKIRNFIVLDIFIDMMDNFFRRKVSTEMFFHYKAMLFNISKSIAKWMIFIKNKYISLVIFSTSTAPITIILSKVLGIRFPEESFITTFFRTKFPYSYSTFDDIKKFLTVSTLDIFSVPKRTYFSFIRTTARFTVAFSITFSHIYLRNKKALFGLLERMPVGILNLLSAYNFNLSTNNLSNEVIIT